MMMKNFRDNKGTLIAPYLIRDIPSMAPGLLRKPVNDCGVDFASDTVIFRSRFRGAAFQGD
jgi:hypothetical protein